jgi:hypothetical protein
VGPQTEQLLDRPLNLAKFQGEGRRAGMQNNVPARTQFGEIQSDGLAQAPLDPVPLDGAA